MWKRINFTYKKFTWFEWRSKFPKRESTPISVGNEDSELFLKFDATNAKQISKMQIFQVEENPYTPNATKILILSIKNKGE